MAGTPRNKCRILQFTDQTGERRTIRLGAIPEAAFNRVRANVKALVTAKSLRVPPEEEVQLWASKLEGKLADKLADFGLIARREQTALGPFLEAYIASRAAVKPGTGRADLKPNTLKALHHARRCLIEYFGADKQLEAISAGDTDDYRRWLGTHAGLAENTIRRRCGFAKQFFRVAVRKRLLRENPFSEMASCAVRENKERFYFISREDAARVLDACPNALWRLIFALSRFGGLRCRSEHFALRWDDVDWGHDRFTVQSPKTEHHEGRESRVVPIFPELRSYLDEAWEQAERGAEYVLPRRIRNFRGMAEKIIKRAGLKVWPKLFQNLRSTRETELVEQFPIQVVCAWLGNTPAVARKHYLQVTEEHFARALEPRSALQKALQQSPISRCKPMQATEEARYEDAANAVIPGVCSTLQGMPEAGMALAEAAGFSP